MQTRHLKIRATALRELLQKEQWELRHLKGAELVADGQRALRCGMAEVLSRFGGADGSTRPKPRTGLCGGEESYAG